MDEDGSLRFTATPPVYPQFADGEVDGTFEIDGAVALGWKRHVVSIKDIRNGKGGRVILPTEMYVNSIFECLIDELMVVG